MIRKQSTFTDYRSQSEIQTIESPQLHSAEPIENNNSQDRKRYNIISEELRKQIIKKLTVDKKTIKEVSKEFDLKLSTCKAILQVYLKEGRIGKKTTRDRKSKIVNTVLIATINPLNPLQSTLTPYVSIQEHKTSNKNMSDSEQQEHLISDAISKASQHFQGVYDQHQSQNMGQSTDNTGNSSHNVQIPQESLNQLQSMFMQTQIQIFNQFLMSQATQMDKSGGNQSFLANLQNLMGMSLSNNNTNSHNNQSNNSNQNKFTNNINNNSNNANFGMEDLMDMTTSIQKVLNGNQGQKNQNPQNLTLNSQNFKKMDGLFSHSNSAAQTPTLRPLKQKNESKTLILENNSNNNNNNLTSSSNNNNSGNKGFNSKRGSGQFYSNCKQKDSSSNNDKTSSSNSNNEIDIDNEIEETIQKKIMQDKNNYIRKNSIIIQKQEN